MPIETVTTTPAAVVTAALRACPKCKREFSPAALRTTAYLCPACGAYMPMPARERTEYLSDTGAFRELFGEETFADPLSFPDYEAKYTAACRKSGENEGVLCGVTRIGSHDTALFVMNPDFMMGSMGTVVGDRIAALFRYAIAHRLPVIGYTVSGGARMQEGMLSLMQMAKVSAAVKEHSDRGLLYIVGLTDPTMGGVTASFAMLGDIIFAEPGARVGFAGKRVVEQVTGEKLPDTFQTAEFQLQNGFVDGIVERAAQRAYLERLLAFHES